MSRGRGSLGWAARTQGYGEGGVLSGIRDPDAAGLARRVGGGGAQEGGRTAGSSERSRKSVRGGCPPGLRFPRVVGKNARGEKDCLETPRDWVWEASRLRGGRDGKGRRNGTSTRPPAAAQPPGRGATPALPLPRTIQAGPGRAGLGPRTPPLPPTTSPASPAPAESGGGGGVSAGPRRPSNFLQVHSHASRPFDSLLSGREGPCPPWPLPPGYIRSRRSRPRPGPEGRG